MTTIPTDARATLAEVLELLADVRARLTGVARAEPPAPAPSVERATSSRDGRPRAGSTRASARDPKRAAPARAAVVERTAAASRLAELVERFTLTPFERDVLLLCAGVELDPAFADAVERATANGADRAARGPTFALALATLPHAHWSALAPTAALRRWRLVELHPGCGVSAAPLRIDERILHHLAGVSYLDPRLEGIVEPVHAGGTLAPSQAEAARVLLETWLGGASARGRTVVLNGRDTATHELVAAVTAGSIGLRVHRLRASAIPATAAERLDLVRLWERESMLLRSALLVVVDADAPEDVRERVRAFAAEMAGLVAVSGAQRIDLRGQDGVHVALEAPGSEEQVQLWRRALGERGASLNGALERIASQFRLDVPMIRAAAAEALAGGSGDLASRLWQACRHQLRTTMDGLAQRIEPLATWDDLVLPDAQLALLHTIVAQARQRARVTGAWGFARKSERGLGIHALFAGPSGTGKTMAAEVIARELALDLHRVDLSAVTSKYVGETEKNLRRVFDAAERSGAILLFDEADALFGRRSEVRDSHDRYANLEVSYLLQRCDSYSGVSLLTTNLKGALDSAFARRLRFTVHFPFPEEAQRLEIWKRVFPEQTPRKGLDHAKLARLSLSGGQIRNVALNAAFLAADAGEPVRMRHLAAAVQAEHAKLERPFNESELAGWA